MVDPSSVYLLIFIVSLGTSVAMFALGIGHIPGFGHNVGHGGGGHGGGHVGHGGHAGPAHVHGPADAHGHGAADAESVSPINMATILAFLTWFSGAGYILTSSFRLSVLLAGALATIVGFGAALGVFLVLVRILLPGQTPYLEAEDYEMEGTVGRLTVGIREGGTGELVFSRGGSRHVAGARSSEGDPIVRGTEVVVVRHERGIAYVKPFEDFLREESEGGAQPPVGGTRA